MSASSAVGSPLSKTTTPGSASTKHSLGNSVAPRLEEKASHLAQTTLSALSSETASGQRAEVVRDILDLKPTSRQLPVYRRQVDLSELQGYFSSNELGVIAHWFEGWVVADNLRIWELWGVDLFIELKKL